MGKLQDRLRSYAQDAATSSINAIRFREAADALDAMEAALLEARDALNGAPNTVGLHNQISNALAKLEGAK